jgi:hypothetical protein
MPVTLLPSSEEYEPIMSSRKARSLPVGVPTGAASAIASPTIELALPAERGHDVARIASPVSIL